MSVPDVWEGCAPAKIAPKRNWLSVHIKLLLKYAQARYQNGLRAQARYQNGLRRHCSLHMSPTQCLLAVGVTSRGKCELVLE